MLDPPPSQNPTMHEGGEWVFNYVNVGMGQGGRASSWRGGRDSPPPPPPRGGIWGMRYVNGGGGGGGGMWVIIIYVYSVNGVGNG